MRDKQIAKYQAVAYRDEKEESKEHEIGGHRGLVALLYGA
jgi:hypothetical protein